MNCKKCEQFINTKKPKPTVKPKMKEMDTKLSSYYCFFMILIYAVMQFLNFGKKGLIVPGICLLCCFIIKQSGLIDITVREVPDEKSNKK
jgi:hypothetical protein